MVDTILCLAISGEDSITEVGKSTDDPTFGQNSLGYLAAELSNCILLSHPAHHYHLVKRHDDFVCAYIIIITFC